MNERIEELVAEIQHVAVTSDRWVLADGVLLRLAVEEVIRMVPLFRLMAETQQLEGVDA